IAKEDRIIFFICHSFLVTNEKAALSKTVSRFWTIPLLRLLIFAYFACPVALLEEQARRAFNRGGWPATRFAWLLFFVTGFQE
ncbi:hypothetical protein, partial [Desulfonatronospira sp.]|uniref:hypothetical protein n=1 Tax=Desulfonatronospira sp. TaxID=1962951 RepID=UPI0025B95D20